MAIKHLLLLAAAPLVRAFGTLRPSPLPDPNAPIELDVQTEGARDPAILHYGYGTKYVIVAPPGSPGWVAGCPCNYVPLNGLKKTNKKCTKGKHAGEFCKNPCFKAMKWLQKADPWVEFAFEGLRTTTSKDAYDHLQGCRYRDTISGKKVVYYQVNKDADGVEDPAPLGNFQLICKFKKGFTENCYGPPPDANVDTGPKGICSEPKDAIKNLGYTGCQAYTNKRDECRKLVTSKNCCWQGDCCSITYPDRCQAPLPEYASDGSAVEAAAKRDGKSDAEAKAAGEAAAKAAAEAHPATGTWDPNGRWPEKPGAPGL